MYEGEEKPMSGNYRGQGDFVQSDQWEEDEAQSQGFYECRASGCAQRSPVRQTCSLPSDCPLPEHL